MILICILNIWQAVVTKDHQDELKNVDALSEFAPLHNYVCVNPSRRVRKLMVDILGRSRDCQEYVQSSSSGNILTAILDCLHTLPKAVNLLYFDTAFHSTIPEAIYTYPLDPGLDQKLSLPGGMKLRKYGFHGLSYASVLKSVSKYLGKPAEQTNIIVAHLGVRATNSLLLS